MEEKYQLLEEKMQMYAQKDLVVAFSGGVDSSLLLELACEAAKENGTTVYAVTMQTRLHPAAEIDHARRVAEEVGAVHCVIPVDELMEAGIKNNPAERCYLCKKCLFEKLLQKAEELHTDVVLEGTNEDDLHVYRPGLRAIRELGIHSPLAEAGLTKAEVRELAGRYGLSVSDRPAMPCLATRFPYGTELSYEELHRVERGEDYIRSLGFYNVRLRVHGDIVRMEVDTEAFPAVLERRGEILAQLKQLGYTYITMDLEGFRSGSMDIHIKS
ncbi:MAG TPA: ATP-dependent sacrificial sulfur transferase LarE [Lachnospiraceae bacterium]|nr:ATP-dependent sacrificial sulfur transferase LarE [Lachnospiraceae bacterium]